MKRPGLWLPMLMVVCAALAAPAFGRQEPAAEEAAPTRELSLGVIASGGADTVIPPGTVVDPARPPYVRVTAAWGDVEREAGVFDWSAVEPAVTRARDAGMRVVVCLTGGNSLYLPEGMAPSPLEGPSLQKWTEFVRSAVRTLGGKASVFEIWDGPSRIAAGSESPVFDPAIYAFVLKNSALAARAEARAAGFEVQIAQGALESGALAWQQSLWENDTAAYIDVLPVRFPAGGAGIDVGAALLQVLTEAVQHPPAPALWAYFERVPGARPMEPVAAAVSALSSSASVALGEIAGEPGEQDLELRFVLGVQKRLESGYVPAPVGGLALRTPEGGERSEFRILGRFLHEKSFDTLVVYDAPTGGLQGGQARLVLDSADVKEPKVIDPVRDVELLTGPGAVPGVSRPALRLLLADHPMLVTWGRVAVNPDLELPPEALQVQSTRGLTAEEIIARYQAVQKVQDDRLDRWTARGRLNFSFKLAQGGSSFDVSIDSTYFWERGGQLEWEQVKYYINGNAVPWKNIPEIPLIQPEKVAVLPLDLTLDRKYVYRLLDEDRVGDRAAYVLGFEPAGPEAGKSLYRGRVWIDKETFERLKASVIQTGLEPPVTSNEETDLFTTVRGPDGFDYRMLTNINGQQLWIIGGRNVVVRREVSFETFEINPAPDSFEARRKEAYASKNQMLRDTDQGFRYLDRAPDGTRDLQTKENKDVLFLAFGALKDSSYPNIVPLAGVNYFKFDALGKNNQFNIFFAGVLAFLNYSDPAVRGSRVDLTVEGALNALKRDDKVFTAGEEIVSERIRVRSQYFSGRLGVPAGSFVKFTLVASAEYNQYFDADVEATSTRAAGQVFVLPQDHTVLAATGQVEFNRKGVSVTARYSGAARSTWEPWGLYDTGTGTFVDPEYQPSQKTFSYWGLTAFKEWYLPKFQKLRVEADYLDGRDLDRFSRWRFSLFGDDRLNGFAGTGVRFDRGYIARLGYSFNLFNVVRLDFSADAARVKDRELNTDFQDFGGLGLSGNVVGPWKTVISLSYGRAMRSDIPELVGKQEFLLVILKLF